MHLQDIHSRYIPRRFMTMKRRKQAGTRRKRHLFVPSCCTQVEDDVNVELLAGQVQLSDVDKERLVSLKRKLQDKNELLWQLQEQETSFLGGDDVEGVRGNEFVGSLSQDYLIIPGRPSSLLPAGSRLRLYGQLPNRRWRCCALKCDGSDAVDSSDVPLLGSVPTSVICELSLSTDVNDDAATSIQLKTPSCSSESESDDDDEESHDADDSYVSPSPYSKHRSVGPRRTVLNDDPSHSDEQQDTTLLRSNAKDIVISRRLRQVGISIVVGSSSSEEDDIDDISASDPTEEQPAQADLGQPRVEAGNLENHCGAEATSELKEPVTEPSSEDAEDQASHTTESPEKSAIFVSQKTKEQQPSYSPKTATKSSDIPVLRITTDTELLLEYGSVQSPIELQPDGSPKLRRPSGDLSKSIHPPRNVSRTLRLLKQTDGGYGFTVETFIFLNSTGDNESRTVVRSVEEDGPAFDAGLRAGDVVVEVNGKTVEGAEHWDLIKDVIAAEDQLLLLVKFIDAVRHAELTMKLFERQAKIKSKFAEYELLCKREGEFMAKGYPSNDEELVDMKDDLYTETGLLSAPDNIVIKTSRFELHSSAAVHGVKEIKCDERLTISRRGIPIPKFTTDYDLLEAYASNDDNAFRKIYQRLTGSLKRSASMPDTRIDLTASRHDTRARLSVDGVSQNSTDAYRPKTLSDSGYSLSPRTHKRESMVSSLTRGLRPKSYKLALSNKPK